MIRSIYGVYISARAAIHGPLQSVSVNVIAATALAMGLTALACSDRPNPNEPLARAIAGRLSRSLNVAIASLGCPRDGAPGDGFVCSGSLASGESFAVEVTGVGGDGKPVWKPRGKLKFEYQIAEGFAAAVRARPRTVACPAGGDVSAGFHCQVTLEDGTVTSVHVTAAEESDRFVWRADEVLMLGAIEEQIRSDLLSRGKQALVDCGQGVQKSVAGRVFECALHFIDGTSGMAEVSIVDAEGHVQYRIDKSPEEARRQAPGQAPGK